jgi:hypothetical protein
VNSIVIVHYVPLAFIAVVLLAGALVAIVRWSQHPGVSMAALFGCLLLLFAIVGFAVVDRILIEQAAMGRLGWTVTRWARAFIEVAGFALLFVAAFGWRQKSRDRYERFDPRDESRRDRPEFERRADDFGATDRGSENVQKPRD